MAPRPRLASAHRPLVRVGGAVQLGLRPESGAVLLSGLTAAEVAFLDRLDGRHTEAGLYAVAHAVGVESRRAEELLAVLRRHGVLASESARVSVPHPPAPGARRRRFRATGDVDRRPAARRGRRPRRQRPLGGRRRRRGPAHGRRRRPARPGRPRHRPGRRPQERGTLVAPTRTTSPGPGRRRPRRVGPWISGDPAEPCLECLRLRHGVPPGCTCRRATTTASAATRGRATAGHRGEGRGRHHRGRLGGPSGGAPSRRAGAGPAPRPHRPAREVTVSQTRTGPGTAVPRAPTRPATRRTPARISSGTSPITGDESRPTRVSVRVSSASSGRSEPPTV